MATTETVAFPKESDIAAKPSLVQMVPLCQMALEPRLRLSGYDGNGGISKKRVTSQPNQVSFKRSHFVKLHSIHICVTLATMENGGISKRESDIAAKTRSRSNGGTSVKLRSIHICVTLATMETVAFPKESDIAAKPILVHMVPLCQIALDPHLCLIGYDGNGGIAKRESDIAAKPSLVQVVPLCQMALEPRLCLIGNDGNGGISKRV